MINLSIHLPLSQTLNDLKTNWRSFDTIVNFNNDFFTCSAHYLKDSSYQNLYLEQCRQKSNNKVGGYVEITFAPKDIEEIDVFYCEKVLETITKVLNKGFSFKNICVLVRRNKEGVLLADYLAERSIPIISSEALLLANNPEVQFLVSLLRFLDNPSENTIQFDVFEYLLKEQENRHNLIVHQLGNLTEFLKLEYNYNIVIEVTMSALDILERAISAFHLSDKCGAHVIHFLDVVQEISEKSGVGIQEFLIYWDLKKDDLAISAPHDQDAVQLMTVHKSKGLEFPFVIFPFADAKINDGTRPKKLWVPLSDEVEPGFDALLVSASKELSHYSTATNEIYTTENHLSELDDFNVLYVAMTRAIEGLFVLTKESQTETYGKLFKNYLLEKDLWSTDTSHFVFGGLLKNTRKKSNGGSIDPIPYIYTQINNSENLAISSPSLWYSEIRKSLEWGKMVHEILSEINTSEDVEKTLTNALKRGTISLEAKQPIESTLHAIVNHPKLSPYFLEGNSVKNEVEIIDAKGNLFRPDRLVFKGDQVTIIDYKTGENRPEHVLQLKNYATLLHELGFVVTNQILVYIEKKIEPVFI